MAVALPTIAPHHRGSQIPWQTLCGNKAMPNTETKRKGGLRQEDRKEGKEGGREEGRKEGREER